VAYSGSHGWNRQNTRRCNHAVRIYEKPNIAASFEISRYGESKTLGELIRKCRLERDLYAKDLAKMIGVTEQTITNWENGNKYLDKIKSMLFSELLRVMNR
jgi:DNA-binding XRE family transcriptional regulator